MGSNLATGGGINATLKVSSILAEIYNQHESLYAGVSTDLFPGESCEECMVSAVYGTLLLLFETVNIVTL